VRDDLENKDEYKFEQFRVT